MIPNVEDALRQPAPPPVGQTDIEDDTDLGRKPENETKRLTIAEDRLRSFVARIERLAKQRDELGEDITDIYKEVKSAGFVPAIVRQLIAERKKDAAVVEEQTTLLDIYRRAVEG